MMIAEGDCAAEDEACYVNFGMIVRRRLGMQCQYASRHVDGRHGAEDLGQGLRFKGRPADYHELRKHRDDVETFVDRLEALVNPGMAPR